MMANQLSPEELASVQALLDADPGVQAAIQRYQQAKPGPDKRYAETLIHQAVRNSGVELPHDYFFNSGTGQVEQENFFQRNPWVAPAIPFLGAAGATAAAGAGGAAAAGGGGGAGTGGAAGAGTAAGGAGGASAGTAGASVGSRILGGAQAIAPILGGMASGAQAGNTAENQGRLARDRAALERYELQAKLPGINMSQAFRGGMIANRQPTEASWGGPGSGLRGETVQFSGGFSNPALYEGTTRQVAEDAQAQALERQLARGSDVPEVTPWQDQGAGSNILGGAAIASSILGGFAPRNNQQQQLSPGGSRNFDESAEPFPDFDYQRWLEENS
jgi:hypothetical protein